MPEQKIKYQYSYFIYPFIIPEENYDKYLLKLLKDKHCKLKIFEREKDMHLYTYFMPRVRDYLFPSFTWDKEKQKQFDEFSINTKALLLAQKPCTIFEYELKKDVQGRVGKEDTIFFTVPKIEIVCFQTGIGFLLMKTIIEGENTLADVLNFNYKFRDIHAECSNLKNYENIHLQSSNFKDRKELSHFIKEITGNCREAKAMNLENEKFFTYSYVCLEQECWNETKPFATLQDDFLKFSYILPSNTQVTIENTEEHVLPNLKYAKLGCTKQGATLLASAIYTENYTKLPFTFENEYLYTYLLALYKKIYFKKLNYELEKNKNFSEINKKFTDFTQSIWIEEVTDDIIGSDLCKKWEQVLELQDLYMAIKVKYDIVYKERNIEKNTKMAYVLAGILLALFGGLVINIFTLYLK